MLDRLRAWLHAASLHDPIERQQATLVQIFLISLLAVALPHLAIALVALARHTGDLPSTLANLTSTLCSAGALVLLRRGRFRTSIMLATIGILCSLTIFMIGAGVRNSGLLPFAFAIPLTLAGLLAGRRGLLLTSGLSVAIVAVTAVLELHSPPLAGFAPLPNHPADMAVSFILIVGLLTLFLDRFGTSLRDALNTALARERELEQIRASLGETIAEQTATLRSALETAEQRELCLAQTVEELRASQAIVRTLSAPVIPVLDGVLVVPLIGALDSARAAMISENVLASVDRLHTYCVIFDITGVPVIDTTVAQALLRTAAAIRLLGAQVLLVGIRPEVAQTIVALGLSLDLIVTYPNLQEAVEALLTQRKEAAAITR